VFGTGSSVTCCSSVVTIRNILDLANTSPGQARFPALNGSSLQQHSNNKQSYQSVFEVTDKFLLQRTIAATDNNATILMIILNYDNADVVAADVDKYSTAAYVACFYFCC
jgi:hypothetical protein